VQHAPDQLQALLIVSAQAVLAHISKSLCLLYQPVRHTLSPNSQVLLSRQPIHHSAGQYSDTRSVQPRSTMLVTSSRFRRMWSEPGLKRTLV